MKCKHTIILKDTHKISKAAHLDRYQLLFSQCSPTRAHTHTHTHTMAGK